MNSRRSRRTIIQPGPSIFIAVYWSRSLILCCSRRTINATIDSFGLSFFSYIFVNLKTRSFFLKMRKRLRSVDRFLQSRILSD